MLERALARLRESLGNTACKTAAADIEPHLVEWRGLYRGNTAMVVHPHTTAEVSQVVRICAEEHIPIVPQGGNTGLSGGGVPAADGNNIVLCLDRMMAIRDVDADNYSMTVEAGCILSTLQDEAARQDRLFPLSLGAEGSCRIGGNIATNAGGVQVLRYGNMRDLVLGLEVVLADGEIWNGLKALRKDNTGYDLRQLFIGSEGTLGIITAATLRLFPRPIEVATALIGIASPEAAMNLFVRARAATGDQMTAFELMPRFGIEIAMRHVVGCIDPFDQPWPHYVLLELASARPGSGLRDTLESFLGTGYEDGLVLDAVIATSVQQAQAFWKLREGLVEAQRHEGGSIKHDVSVPVSSIPAFIAEASEAIQSVVPGTRPVPFGHVGDGNVHFNLTQPLGMDREAFLARWGDFNRVVHDIVARYHGSISAEHGVGLLRREELRRYKSPVELDLMRRIKVALDPANIMNPGKIIPDP